jgi:hypothetical protein
MVWFCREVSIASCPVRRNKTRRAYHPIRLDIRRLDTLRLLDRLLPYNLNPVPIRVQHKRNMAHAPVRQLLLELIPGVFNALARGLQVVDADARVAKAAVRLDVAVVDLVLGVVLGAVVVSQLDEALAVPHVVAAGRGLGRVVAEEVEIELGVGELEFLD